MFNTDIILNPTAFGGTNANKTYSLVLPLGADSSLRRVSATSATTPETLKIAHQQTSSKNEVGTLAYNQHLLRLDQAFTDSIKGTGALSAWFCLRNPIGTTAITSQMIIDLIGRLFAFEQSSGYLDKILNNEP
jgi:hypothetical protein